MKLPRAEVDISAFEMLFYNLKFLDDVARSSTDVSNAPVLVMVPYHYIPIDDPTQPVFTIDLPKMAKFQRIYAVGKNVTVWSKDLYNVTNDKLVLTNVYEGVKGIILEGYSYPNEIFKKASERLGWLGQYYRGMYPNDPIEFNFRIRDTFYVLKNLPREWALTSLVNLMANLPYARVSGKILKVYLYPFDKLQILYDTGSYIYFHDMWLPARIRQYWSVPSGTTVYRGQPFTNLVQIETKGCRVKIKIKLT